MTFEQITTHTDALHLLKRKLQRAGLLQEFAHRVGTYRRWKRNRCPAITLRNWVSTVLHQFDENHPFQLSFRDFWIARELLGEGQAA